MATTEALVFDAIRTPRGKGKVNGSLHTTKPVDLVVGLMHEMLIRNERLDPKRVDDVVLGCDARSGKRRLATAIVWRSNVRSTSTRWPRSSGSVRASDHRSSAPWKSGLA